MTVDWDFIFKVDLDELNDQRAELLYDQLIEVRKKNVNFNFQ